MPDPFSEIESETSLKTTVPEEVIKSYDPIARAKARKKELPKSRYAQTPSLDYGRFLGCISLKRPCRSVISDNGNIDTSTAPLNTTAVPCTLTDLHHHRTPRLESSFRAPSLFPEWSRPTSRPSHPTSSRSATSTTHRASSHHQNPSVSAHGTTAPLTTRTDPSADPAVVTSSACSASPSPSTTSPKWSGSRFTAT